MTASIMEMHSFKEHLCRTAHGSHTKEPIQEEHPVMFLGRSTSVGTMTQSELGRQRIKRETRLKKALEGIYNGNKRVALDLRLKGSTRTFKKLSSGTAIVERKSVQDRRMAELRQLVLEHECIEKDTIKRLDMPCLTSYCSLHEEQHERKGNESEWAETDVFRLLQKRKEKKQLGKKSYLEKNLQLLRKEKK